MRRMLFCAFCPSILLGGPAMSLMVHRTCSLQLSSGSSLHPPHSLLGLCTPDTRGQIPRGGCVCPWCLSRRGGFRYNRRAWRTHDSLLWMTCNGPLHYSEYSTCDVSCHDDTSGTVTTHLASIHFYFRFPKTSKLLNAVLVSTDFARHHSRPPAGVSLVGHRRPTHRPTFP